jgi:trigger factor
MVTKQIVKQPKAQVDVTVTVPWADIAPKWDETLNRMAQEVELPGFRKGQAPLPMVEQSLGKKVEDEVIKVVMPQALIDALTGTDVVPIDFPKYQILAFQKGSDLQFLAKVTERPGIQVGDYKTIKVTKPEMKPVTDDEVDKIITDLFGRWKARQPQIPQTSSENPTGPQGSLSFNGAQTPAASAPVSDQPDDNFAKAVGGDSLMDLKQKIKQDLSTEVNYQNELDYEEAILGEVEKITTVDIPDILVEDEENRMLLSLQKQVSDRGMLMEEYLKSQNTTIDALKEKWHEQAIKNVRMELGLSEVARRENINISDEELQAEIDKIQDAKVKAQFAAQEPRMHLRHALRQTKTLTLLKDMVTKAA